MSRTEQRAPRECPDCGNTPVSPGNATVVYPRLSDGKRRLVEQAKDYGGWVCVHCPQILHAGGGE